MTSRGYAVPLNRFDMQAGGKVLYEALEKPFFLDWEKLTAQEQAKFAKALKAGIIAAQKAKQQKVTGRLLRLLPARRIAP